MKKKRKKGRMNARLLFKFTVLASMLIASNIVTRAGDNRVTFGEVIGSARTNDLRLFESTSRVFLEERKQSGSELIGLLTDSKSSNLNQCAAAYYLGEIRFADAAEVLASRISLAFDLASARGDQGDRYPAIGGYPAFDALIKIGITCIPSLLRNIEESDDKTIQQMSLQAIVRIEQDKDVAHLRIRKAFEKQKDESKKSRLEAALRSLVALP